MSRRCTANPRSGLTLAEVMLASFLAFLVSSLLLGLILPSMRQLNRGSKQSALDQEAILLLDQLERDVSACAPGRVTYLPQDAATSWLFAGRLGGIGPRREQLWDPSAPPFPNVLYRFHKGASGGGRRDDQPLVIRLEGLRVASGLDLSQQVRAPALSQITNEWGNINSLDTHRQERQTNLAPHLADFTCNPLDNKGCFRVTLALERDDMGDSQKLRLEVERVLAPRNTTRTE